MSEPIVVVIPHRLGKDEALRRIKDGIGRAKTEFAWILSLEEEAWTGDRLTFRASALGQRASGFIDVYEGGCAARGHVAVAARTFCACGSACDRTEGPIDAGKEVAATCPAASRGGILLASRDEAAATGACMTLDRIFFALYGAGGRCHRRNSGCHALRAGFCHQAIFLDFDRCRCFRPGCLRRQRNRACQSTDDECAFDRLRDWDCVNGGDLRAGRCAGPVCLASPNQFPNSSTQ